MTVICGQATKSQTPSGEADVVFKHQLLAWQHLSRYLRCFISAKPTLWAIARCPWLVSIPREKRVKQGMTQMLSIADRWRSNYVSCSKSNHSYLFPQKQHMQVAQQHHLIEQILKNYMNYADGQFVKWSFGAPNWRAQTWTELEVSELYIMKWVSSVTISHSHFIPTSFYHVEN